MTITELRHCLDQVKEKGKQIQEIRIRTGRPVMVQASGEEICLEAYADSRLIRDLMEVFSRHSLYAFEEEIRQGFLTIDGGHRIGLSGHVVLDNDRIRTMKYISGLNIRVAHECKGCADPVIPWIYENQKVLSVMFLSPPGAGKTTILRDVVRQVSDGNPYGRGMSVSVVDERSELGACFQGIPQCDLGKRTDILNGCPKVLGINMVIRSMNPSVIAVDEIGTKEDFQVLRESMQCGCRIFATVHGDSIEDVKRKRILGEMAAENMFDRYIVLGRVPEPGRIMGIYDSELRRLQ